MIPDGVENLTAAIILHLTQGDLLVTKLVIFGDGWPRGRWRRLNTPQSVIVIGPDVAPVVEAAGEAPLVNRQTAQDVGRVL